MPTMPDIDIRDRATEDKPHRRRSVLVSPSWRYSPPGSRWGGYSLSYSSLRSLAKKSPTVAAILRLRTNQLTSFARPPRHKGDRGFEIVRADDPGSTKPHDERICEQVRDFFLHTGWSKHGGVNGRPRDSFADYLAKTVRDYYLIAAPATEIVYDTRGTPSEIWAIDGATIELQWAERYIPTTRYGKDLDQPVAYVQVVDGQIETEYAADELIFVPADPVTDVEQGGYGISALEHCVDWAAAEVLALQYNSNYFDHGSVPPGILAVIGNLSDEVLDTLNVMWETDVKGVIGQHKPVAIAIEDGKQIQWIPMKQSNKDMEMGSFTDKLRTNICSVFGADPVEIGQRTAGNSDGMSSSDNTEAKIDLSRDRGLVPLMQWYETIFNRHLLPRLAPGYLFRWTGINAEDERQKVDYLNSQLEAGGIVVAEWRKAMGLDEVPPGAKDGKWLHAPLNPQALQVWMQENGMAQQAMVGQKPGQPGQQGQPAAGALAGAGNRRSSTGTQPRSTQMRKALEYGWDYAWRPGRSA